MRADRLVAVLLLLQARGRITVAALPEPFRPAAEAAASSVVVDPAGWGEPPPRSGPEHLAALQRTTADGVQVLLGYRGRDGAASTRTVHPLGVVHKGRVWYLVAGTEAGLRTFRVGRVTAVQPTAEPVARPAAFDLAEAWRHISDRIEELRTPARVSALAVPEVISALRWTFGTALRVGPTHPDRRVEVSVGGQVVELLARRLAGFGGLVEVTGPPAARTVLAGLGRELVDTYRPAPDGVGPPHRP